MRNVADVAPRNSCWAIHHRVANVAPHAEIETEVEIEIAKEVENEIEKEVEILPSNLEFHMMAETRLVAQGHLQFG